MNRRHLRYILIETLADKLEPLGATSLSKRNCVINVNKLKIARKLHLKHRFDAFLSPGCIKVAGFRFANKASGIG